MNAIDELRRMLDKRGVEYDESTLGNTTLFKFDCHDYCDGYRRTIAITDSFTGACISAYIDYLTPEEAIASTLGSGACKGNIGYNGWFVCNECGHNTMGDYYKPNYCSNCGRRVIEE